MKVMPEDLMETVVRAALWSAKSGNATTPRHSRFTRRWIEPWFNAAGWMLGQVLASMPWPLRWRGDQAIARALGARPSATPASFEARKRDCVALAGRLHRETGQWPALMVFTSHPPTLGSLEWLRFELVREGLLLANAMVDASPARRYLRSAPQCFLAIDPFALDTIPPAVAGLYSGFMHRIYLVWDRQSGTQSWIQRHLLLRGTGYDRIARRLLACLKRDAPIVMVLPGGLPPNARLLYTGREFILRLPVSRWPYPKRTAQKKWMEALARPVEGELPIETGELPAATRQELDALLAAWGISPAERSRWLEVFAQAFRPAVPARPRLFQFLLKRIAAKGKPFLWVGVMHRDQAPYVQVTAPWGAYKTADGDLRLIRGAEGSTEVISDIGRVAADFSREF